MMHVKEKILIFIGLFVIIAVCFLPEIPQDTTYHLFADHKTLFSVPNFADVVSNFGFILVGAIGLIQMYVCKISHSFEFPKERLPYLMFYFSIILVGFGSSYYHIAPDNITLFWDRLPISIMIMSLFSALIAERISLNVGVILAPIFAFIGAASVSYWLYTETINAGDLRFYALVQFLPILLSILILIFYRTRYTAQYNWWMILGWYAIAKLFEHYDHLVYNISSHVISGHTLKHIFSTFATCHVLYYLQRRELVKVSRP